MASIKKSILIRVRTAFLLVLLFAVAVAARIYYIQFHEGELWAALNRQITLTYRKIKATRGNIYSDNGSLLATSIPFYRVAFDPGLATDKLFDEGIDSLSMLLAQHYGDKSATHYERIIRDARSNGRRYIVLNRKQINYQAKKMMSLWPIFRAGQYRGGGIFQKSGVRYRPFSHLGKRTIGFINENGKGAGLEYSFNDVLSGRDGEALFQKIAGGVWRPVFDVKNLKSVDGLDINTTIDVNLQDVAQTALYRAMQRHQADEGTVVVMAVKTGYIKAISNLSREGDGYYEKFNHAVGGLYEPGSTFKLVTMMALLDEGHVGLSDSVDTGNGTFTFYKNKVRDHHKGGFGKITIQRAFEHSSNVAMAKLLNRYFGDRPTAFLRYIDRLNLSHPLGLQIAGEGHPKITRPKDKDWSGITLPWMAYGYGFEITPLHTLSLFNAIANGGKMVKPIFVASVSQADEVVEEYTTEVLANKICSPHTLSQLKLLLEGVVERGTAMNLKNKNYKTAGKTGTAVILKNGLYVKKYTTSFVGYFPADNPKYTAMVLIKNPKGKQQYGNNVAGPVFKEIADNIYSRDIRIHLPMRRKKIFKAGLFPVIQAGKQTDLTMLCNELGISSHSRTDEEWARASRDGNAVLWRDNKMAKGYMPDVRGMTFRDALFLLETANLKVKHRGVGRVKEQSPPPGVKVSKNKTVYIRLN